MVLFNIYFGCVHIGIDDVAFGELGGNGLEMAGN